VTSKVREALIAVGAAPLINKVISPMLLEYQRRYALLVRAIPSTRWPSDSDVFNQRTVNPMADSSPTATARLIQKDNDFSALCSRPCWVGRVGRRSGVRAGAGEGGWTGAGRVWGGCRGLKVTQRVCTDGSPSVPVKLPRPAGKFGVNRPR